MAISVQPIQAAPDSSVQTVVMPNTGSAAPEKSAVELASDAARARLSAGQPVIPTPGAPASPANPNPSASAPAQPPAPVPNPAEKQGEQPRVPAGTPEGGQFAEKPTDSPADGQQPPTDAPAGSDPLTVELPIMVAGPDGTQIPLALAADSPETAEGLRQLVAEAASARESGELLDGASAQLQELEDFRTFAQLDGVGFTLAMVGKDLNTARNIVRTLISDPTVFEAVKADLTRVVDNPEELRLLRADVTTERSQASDAMRSEVQANRAVKQNLNEIQTALVAMLPSTMPEAQRRQAFDDMRRDLRDFANQNNLDLLPVAEVPRVLEARLLSLGIDPAQAASQAAIALTRMSQTPAGRRFVAPVRRPTPAPAPAAPRQPAPTAAPAPAARPAPNGQAFVAAAGVRRTVAAVPGAGAGSPGGANPLTVPLNPDGSKMNTEQTLAWHRAQRAAGKTFYAR